MILSIAKLLSVFVFLLGMVLCFLAAPSAPAHSMNGVRDVSLVARWQLDRAQPRSTRFNGLHLDGVRVIDISTLSAPREIASWTGAGAPSGKYLERHSTSESITRQ